MRGQIVDDVRCRDDRSQGYALYVPSTYTPSRPWSLLMAFHPGARGRILVERYRAAAERFGYVVAGSNTSRNGPWERSRAAVQCMSRDLGRDFAIDAGRVYLTGHSGGARLAMQVALGPGHAIAGVIASSAGLPDARPRTTLPFAVVATAGSEDFNYLEMHRLDRVLTSPHRLLGFEGGHEPPPAAVATEAIEWLEVTAAATGRAERDESMLAAIWDAWLTRARAAATALERWERLRAAADAFRTLRDVTSVDQEAATIGGDPATREAQARARADLELEQRWLDEALTIEDGLRRPEQRTANLRWLDERLSDWSATAHEAGDSERRRRARRLLGAIAAGGRERVKDKAYWALLDRVAPRPRDGRQ